MNLNGTEVTPRFSKYKNNNVLALQLLDKYGNLYTTVTVNLTDNWLLDDEYSSFIDTNNNGKGIVKWLEDNNFGKRDKYLESKSGFCWYPCFNFNREMVEQYKVNIKG